jgi:hypothetical protein
MREVAPFWIHHLRHSNEIVAALRSCVAQERLQIVCGVIESDPMALVVEQREDRVRIIWSAVGCDLQCRAGAEMNSPDVDIRYIRQSIAGRVFAIVKVAWLKLVRSFERAVRVKGVSVGV